MLRKKMIGLLTLVILLLGVVGSGITAEKKIVIGTSIITYEHPFYIDVVKGMRRTSKEAGVEMLLNDPKCELAPQVNALETYIVRGVDAIVVYGVDPVGVVPVVEEAIAKGIPVITADMKLQTDKVATFIGSDNLEIGAKVGKWTKKYIEKNMGGKAKIGVLTWLISVACHQRLQGFKDQVTQLPGVKIVTEQNVEKGLRENAMAVTENILTAHKDIDLFFCVNDSTSMGAVSAIEGLGLEGKIKVVGVDIDNEMMRTIKEGKLLATVAQQPLLLGEVAIESALIKVKGKEYIGSDFVPKRIVIPTLLITKENLQEVAEKLEILTY